MNRLMERGIFVRNQSVLQRRVNDTPEVMTLLVKRLGHVNVHPYYVYVHDLVKGVEDLRTTVQTAIDIEKHVRGSTAGFNTPTFVVDAPGGGGKRDAHSFEHYNRTTGISVYTRAFGEAGAAVLLLRSHRLPAERRPSALARPGAALAHDRRSAGRRAGLRCASSPVAELRVYPERCRSASRHQGRCRRGVCRLSARACLIK